MNKSSGLAVRCLKNNWNQLWWVRI